MTGAVPLGAVLAVVLARLALRVDARARAGRLRPTRRWSLPATWRAPLERALGRARLAVEPEVALRWWALGVVCCVWCALVVAPPLTGSAALAGVAGGPLWLRMQSGRADRAARAALPAALDLVVAHLRAGATPVDALRVLAERPGPLAPDFRRIVARLDLGATVEQALGAWGEERPLTGVRAAAGALTMVTIVGGSAATPLEGLAVALRDDETAAAESRALSAQARMSAVVVSLAPIAFLVFSTATDPGSTRVLVDTGVGRICLAAGLGLEALAVLWMRALVGRTA
ncbi:MAG: type II secretion system F family protein [Acidimicrobiia bacterium]